MYFVIVLNKNDPDLISLYKRIGQKNMTKLLRYSVLSIRDTSYINKIRQICKTESAPDVKNGSIRIATAFSTEYDFALSLKEKIKPRMLSQFLKYLMRYTAGIDNILPGFFNDEISFKISETVKLEIAGLNTLKEPKVKKTRPQKPRLPKSTPKPIPKAEPGDFDALSFDSDIDSQKEESPPAEGFDALSILNNILG